jgi:hypothetical protein
MKKVSLLVAVFAAAMMAQAAINVNWAGSSGFYFNANPSVGILGDATGNSTVAYLVYSTDTSIDSIGVGGTLSADTMLASVTITEDGIANDGTMFDSYAWFADNYTGTFSAGYVYAVIFQDNVIGAGDWYYYTTPVALQDITGATPPQALQMNTDLINGNAIDFGSTVAQVIPEPATFGLLGLGAVSAWFLRRSKKAKIEA